MSLPTQEIVFLLVEDFTHLALSSSIEVLRIANMLSGQDLYSWSLMAAGGHSIRSSNGLQTMVDHDLDALKGDAILFVVSGLNVEQRVTRGLCQYLRQQSRHGRDIGALCSGAVVLAEAGLLDHKRCSVHWHYYPYFKERYPDITVTHEVFTTKSKPYTASGGTAGAELMLEMVSRAHGSELAHDVAEQLVMAAVRSEGDEQRLPHHIRYGTRNKILLECLDFMHANIEEPLSPPEIADLIGISVRQMERIFRRFIGKSPARHYKTVRLEHAKTLLATTNLPVVQVAVACGFTSASHFSKAYRQEFGQTPYSVTSSRVR